MLWRSLFNTRNVVVLFRFFGLLFLAACLYNASLLRLHPHMDVGAIVPIILFLTFYHGFFGVGYGFHRLEDMVMDANVRFRGRFPSCIAFRRESKILSLLLLLLQIRMSLDV
jgi:hypothetical protein